MEHPDEMALVRYVNKTAAEEEAGDLAHHIFLCTDCLEKVAALRYLRRHLDGLWDRWTAREHGRILLRWRIAEVLVEAAHADRGLLERAFSWLQAMPGEAGMAVRIIVSREGSAAVPLDVPPELGYEIFHYLYSTEEPPWQKMVELFDRAHEQLAAGLWEEASASLREARAVSREAAAFCELRFLQWGQTHSQVLVDGERLWLEVTWKMHAPGELPCLLLLLSEKEGAVPPGALPKWSPAHEDFRAEFPLPGEGYYTLCIGPAVPKFQAVF